MLRSGVMAFILVLAAGSAHAQTSFDGVYRSPQGGVTGNARCGTTRFGYPLRVSGGAASLMSVSSGELEGRVGADGSINIEKGAARLVGKITGNHFAGTFVRQSCAYDLQYDK